MQSKERSPNLAAQLCVYAMQQHLNMLMALETDKCIKNIKM